jgi:predicted acyltransferase
METEKVLDSQPARMISLDVFRGMTIAGMTLVNNPGTWSAIYPPLEHAEWNGLTPTDLIFPFFLFIGGISITFALGRRVETGNVNRQIYLKIFKRAFLIFAIGILLQIFPFYNIWKAEWFDPSTMRIPGVLQRIAVCYLISSLIFLHTNWKKQAIIAVVLLLVYWALMTLINVPGCEITTFDDKACNLAAYIDRLILTENHVWSQAKVFDPEGILSTIPAIVTSLAGVLTGHWMKSDRKDYEKVAGIFFFGIVLAAIGWIWSFWFPLNKALWTSSYVVVTAGLALCFLGFCYWLIDLKGYQKWSKPFVIFGTNALALYVGSWIMSSILDIIEIPQPDGTVISLQETIFNNVFLSIASPINASLLYAISFILVWLFLMWLLYRKRIFIKI